LSTWSLTDVLVTDDPHDLTAVPYRRVEHRPDPVLAGVVGEFRGPTVGDGVGGVDRTVALQGGEVGGVLLGGQRRSGLVVAGRGVVQRLAPQAGPIVVEQPHGRALDVEHVGDAFGDRPQGRLQVARDDVLVVCDVEQRLPLALAAPPTAVPLGDVPEDEHHADDIAVLGLDGRAAVGDVPPLAVPADQQRPVGEADRLPLPEHTLDGALDGPLALLVSDVEHLLDGAADGPATVPARQPLCDVVHPGDGPRVVGRDDGVPDGLERDPEVFLALSELRPRAEVLDLLFDGLGEHAVLRAGVTALLEVPVGTQVERLDGHLLAAPAGEDDEGDVATEVLADRLQQFDPVHFRHLVVGDDGVVVPRPEGGERLPRRGGGVDGERLVAALEELAGQRQQRLVVVHVEDVDRGRVRRAHRKCIVLHSSDLMNVSGGDRDRLTDHDRVSRYLNNSENVNTARYLPNRTILFRY
jgi:hypothetical protein